MAMDGPNRHLGKARRAALLPKAAPAMDGKNAIPARPGGPSLPIKVEMAMDGISTV